MKGVNAPSLHTPQDPGRDGISGSLNETFAPDVHGYSLQFYNDLTDPANSVVDYEPIGRNAISWQGPHYTHLTSPVNLYNGNISAMITGIQPFQSQQSIDGPQAMQYRYDQLNRLTGAQSLRPQDSPLDNDAVWIPQAHYNSSYRYDGAGNITHLTRTADQGAARMDELTYLYGTAPDKKNQLLLVREAIGDSDFDRDIDDQLDPNHPNAPNYQYDPAGNLIQDRQEGIDRIEWTIDGKVARVLKSDQTELSFEYDASGQRIAKILKLPEAGYHKTKTTWYLRDAQSNVLSTYQLEVRAPVISACTLDRKAVLAAMLQAANSSPPETLNVAIDQFYEDFIAPRARLVVERWEYGDSYCPNLVCDFQTTFRDVVSYNGVLPDEQSLINLLSLIDQSIGWEALQSALTDPATIARYPHLQSLLTQQTCTLAVSRFSFEQQEIHLYGSARLGLDLVSRADAGRKVTRESDLNTDIADLYYNPFAGTWAPARVQATPLAAFPEQPAPELLTLANPPFKDYEATVYTGILGVKRYELSNHLGNVLVTVSDKKFFDTDAPVPGLRAEVHTAQDYYPFGMTMPGRVGSLRITGTDPDCGSTCTVEFKLEAQYAGTEALSVYRFGFNGKEFDTEWHTDVNYDYGFRIYDPRISRFLSVDPLTASFPWFTPYQFAGNMPIRFIDLDGKEIWWNIVEGGKELLNRATDIDVRNIGRGFASYYEELKKIATYTELNDWYVAMQTGIVVPIKDENGNVIDQFQIRNVDGTQVSEFDKYVIWAGILTPISTKGVSEIVLYIIKFNAKRSKTGLVKVLGRTFNQFGTDVTDLAKVNNRNPVNGQKYAGGTYKLTGELAEKYPNGVKFDLKGFPDFLPYAYKVNGKTVRITVDLVDRQKDIRQAKKKFREMYGVDPPSDHTFHHVENTNEVILVPYDLHDKVRHTGGHATGN